MIDFRLKCQRRALKLALDKLKKTFGSGSSILPLNNVEVVPNLFDGGAVLRVSDLEVSHSVPLDGECTGEKLLLDFRQLLKTVDALPDGVLEIEAEALPPVEYGEMDKSNFDGKGGTHKEKYPLPRDGVKVRGKLGKKTFSTVRWDHQEGNEIPDPIACPKGCDSQEFDVDLAALLAPVLHSVATDDSRYGLNGAYLEIYPDGHIGAVSTDGHRAVAHRARTSAPTLDGPLLPLGVSKKLKDLAPGVVHLTWWRPIAVNGILDGIPNNCCPVGKSRYSILFLVGENEGKDSRMLTRGSTGGITSKSYGWNEKDATCVIRTSKENLDAWLGNKIGLETFCSYAQVTGNGGHLADLYADLGRSDMVRIDAQDGSSLTVRCLEGDFPDWRQVVPARFLREALVDAKAIDESIRYCMTIASEKTHCVRLTTHPNRIEVYVANPDSGEMQDDVQADVTGQTTVMSDQELEDFNRALKEKGKEPNCEHIQFRIGCNGQYLRDEIKTLGSARVLIRFGNELNPITLTRPGDDSLLCLVMPMRIE